MKAKECIEMLEGRFYSPYEAQQVEIFIRSLRKPQTISHMSQIKIKARGEALTITDIGDEQFRASLEVFNHTLSEHKRVEIILDGEEIAGFLRPLFRLAEHGAE